MKHLHLPPDQNRLRSFIRKTLLNAEPLKESIRGYYFVDDIVHRAVNRTAEKVESHTEVKRPSLVYSALLAGTLPGICFSGMLKEPDTRMLGAISAIFMLGAASYINRAMTIIKPSLTGITKSMEDMLLSSARLGFIISGTATFSAGMLMWMTYGLDRISAFVTAGGANMLGISVAMYLVTSSNGYLKRAAEAVAQKLEALKNDGPKIVPDSP